MSLQIIDPVLAGFFATRSVARLEQRRATRVQTMDHPNPHLNGRSIDLEMGKVLGGGSSINVMAWSRGHKNEA